MAIERPEFDLFSHTGISVNGNEGTGSVLNFLAAKLHSPLTRHADPAGGGTASMLGMLRLDSDLEHVGMTWGLEPESVPK
jgi:hypothetical protein